VTARFEYSSATASKSDRQTDRHNIINIHHDANSQSYCVQYRWLQSPYTVSLLLDVPLAENDFGLGFGSILQKNCGFRLSVGFTKLSAVAVSWVGFPYTAG